MTVRFYPLRPRNGNSRFREVAEPQPAHIAKKTRVYAEGGTDCCGCCMFDRIRWTEIPASQGGTI
jgi:hypothetical protein